MELGWYGKARKLKENRNRSTTSIVPLSEGKDGKSYEVRGPVHSTGNFTLEQKYVLHLLVRGTGKVDASSKT